MPNARNKENLINCVKGIYFDENDLLLAETVPLNMVLVRLIRRAVEDYAEDLVHFNMRKDRFVKAIFRGRAPLTSYEQSYPSIKKVNI